MWCCVAIHPSLDTSSFLPRNCYLEDGSVMSHFPLEKNWDVICDECDDNQFETNHKPPSSTVVQEQVTLCCYYYCSCLFKTIASVSNYFHNKRTSCSFNLWIILKSDHAFEGMDGFMSILGRLCHRSAADPNKTSSTATRFLPSPRTMPICWFTKAGFVKKPPLPPLISMPPHIVINQTAQQQN